MSEKKPRYFYWEDAYDSWIPIPDRIDEIFDIESELFEDGDITTIELRIKRVDMTDEEWMNLPEV